MTWEYLPRNTQQVIARQLDGCANVGLLVDRFNPWANQQGKWSLDYGGKRGGDKGLWLKKLCNQRFDRSTYEQHIGRWTVMLKAHRALIQQMRTEGALAVGLGTHNVLETGLTLHRIYGYPYIPGSALKGLARTYALFKVAAWLGVHALQPEDYVARKEQANSQRPSTPMNSLDALLECGDLEGEGAQGILRQLKADPALPADARIQAWTTADLQENARVQDFRAVFGHLGHAGNVLFFDALPLQPPRLVVDVMTPHYKIYYGQSGSPADDDQPNPITFLTVGKGVPFGFAVAPRRKHVASDRKQAKRAMKWLRDALVECGVGAKTNAGYGLFSVVDGQR